MADEIDPATCPACGRKNRCAMACAPSAADGAPCWCTHITIPPAALAGIPPAARGKACLCAECAGQPDRESGPGPMPLKG